MAIDDAAPPDFEKIAKRLKDGTIVPFFGAGASAACGLPSSRALAERLATEAKFPDARGRDDLALVASYLLRSGDALDLHGELRDALALDCQPGRVHRCLADPRLDALRLFVTTNYDDLVERSLEARKPWVVVDRGKPGVVWCRPHGGEEQEVEAKSLRATLVDDKRPIVLKLHGSLDVAGRGNDAFLITEEDYVDFLGRPDGAQVPSMLASHMRERSFLFLGYGLDDWNVRVLLRKLALARPPNRPIKSWAVVRDPGRAEQELWRAQNVEMHDIDLDDFAAGLEEALR